MNVSRWMGFFNVNHIQRPGVTAMTLFSEPNRIFRELAENAPVGIFISQNNGFRYVNASFAALFGNDSGGIMDLDLLDLVAPADRAVVRQHFDDYISGAVPAHHFTIRALSKKKGVINAEIHAARINYHGAPAVGGILLEITVRTRTEDEPKRLASEFRRIVDNMIDTFYRTGSDGQLVLASPSAFDLLGWTPEELLGRRLADLYVDPRGREVFLERLQAGAGRVIGYEAALRRKDGTEVWVETNAHYYRDEDGRISGVEGTVRNITDRKHAEAALRESEERFRRIQELSSAGIAVNEGGIIADCNQSLARITGYEHAELIGMDGILLVTPESRDVAREHVRNGYEKPYISVGLRKDGTTYPVEITGKNIPFHGRFFRVTEFQDISNRVRSEQEREVLQQQLQQAQKMEAIGLLTGGIAHDFNNIITSILGFTKLAIQHSAGRHDQKLLELLQPIVNSGERAANLVAQMLAFSRDNVPGDFRSLELAASLDEVLVMLRPMLPGNIDIVRTYADGVPLIYADPVQLHQTMTNLCINARDAMTNGGVLHIGVRGKVHYSGRCASCHGIIDGEYVEVSIADSGPGIAPELLSHIFQPFFTTKETGKGTGMGLAMVHGIVHRFQGHIVVESPGQGAIFRIFIPAIAANTVQHTETKMPQMASGPAIGARLLVVDDEQLLCAFFSEMFRATGYQVVAYTNPLDAWTAFERNPYAFDLVLTDQTMPGLTGKELVVKLLECRRDMPIIMCTGYSEHLDEGKAVALGAAAFLPKPIDMNRLLEIVARLTQRSGQHAVKITNN